MLTPRKYKCLKWPKRRICVQNLEYDFPENVAAFSPDRVIVGMTCAIQTDLGGDAYELAPRVFPNVPWIYRVEPKLLVGITACEHVNPFGERDRVGSGADDHAVGRKQ